MIEVKTFHFQAKKVAGDALPMRFKDAVNPDRVRRFKASDDTLDRYDEVVLPTGANMKNFSANPVILQFHNHGSWPIGKAVAGGVVNGSVMLDIEFDPPEIDEEADKVLRKIDHGTVSTGSIGFIPKSYVEPGEEKAGKELFTQYPGARRIYTEWELLEYSIVPIPANTSAMLNSMKNSMQERFGSKSQSASTDFDASLDALSKKLDNINSKLRK